MMLGALLARWTRQRSGLLGLIIIITLFAFSPNILASSALATTDLLAAATFLAAILAIMHFWQQPTFWRWLLAALTIGLAISSKLTGLLVVPVTLLLSYTQSRNQPWWKPGLIWLSMLPVAGLVLWASYKFQLGQVELIPFPLPAATFFNNFVEVQQHIERGHYTFLLGERSNEGWLHYFVLAYLVKTPTVTIVLFVVALVYLTYRRRWRETIYLWAPALIFFVFASYSRLNIGYRHILPIVPLLWLLIAESAPLWRSRKSLIILLIAGLLLYAGLSLKQRPHYLAYFSEIVGGSAQGFRYLGDSNLDWVQDLNLLAEYAHEKEDRSLYVSFFGPSDPAYYGLNATPLIDESGKVVDFSPANPAPGQYAISANHIQGTTEDEPDLFDWFRRHDPDGQLGYSILLYDVAERLNGSWIGHCLDPEPSLEQGEASELVGQEPSRHFYFDCRTSWVIPAGNEPGWYILPEELDPGRISDHLAGELTLVYSNLQSSRTPAYRVYHWPGGGDVVDLITKKTNIINSDGDGPLKSPLAIEGTAQFLGGLIYGSVWGSMWQTESLTEAPLSVLMHLNVGEPTPSIADGLGYQGIQWRSGDIFIQYNDFGTLSGQYLETGLYDYTTGERLKFDDGGEVVRIYPIPAE